MTAAGRRAFAARTPERTGVYSAEREKEAQLSRAQLSQDSRRAARCRP